MKEWQSGYIEYPGGAGRAGGGKRRMVPNLATDRLPGAADYGRRHLVNQLGVFSSSWFPAMRAEIEERHRATLEAARDQLAMLWIARGSDDQLVEQNNEQMLRLLDRYGVRYTYTESPGGHNWGLCAGSLPCSRHCCSASLWPRQIVGVRVGLVVEQHNHFLLTEAPQFG